MDASTCPDDFLPNPQPDDEPTVRGLQHYFKDKWQSVAQAITHFGKNKLNTDGVVKLRRNNDILIVGPPRVGKSTLIRAITGDETIDVEATLSSVTKNISSHVSDIFRFWDTPGIEDWTEKEADATWNELFVEKKILPMAVYICFSPGSFFDFSSKGFTKIDDLCTQYEVPIFFICCNALRMDEKFVLGVYKDFKKFFSLKHFVKIRSNIFKMVGKSNAYYAWVNSEPYKMVFTKTLFQPFGVNNLIQQTMQCQSPATRQNLLKFYQKQEGVWSKMGSFLFDLAYTVGFPMEEFLDKESREVYEKLAHDRVDMIAFVSKLSQFK